MKKVLYVLIPIIIVIAMLSAFLFPRSDSVNIYQKDIYCSEFYIEDLHIASGKDWIYIPNGYIMHKTTSDELTHVGWSLSSNGKPFYTRTFNFEFRQDITDNGDYFFTDFGLDKNSKLEIYITYEFNGEKVEYTDEVDLAKILVHSK